MTVYEELKAAGVKLDHHESDLYAEDTETAREIIKKHDNHKTAGKFQSADGTGIWWDIPFAYDPFWQRLPVTAKAS